MGSGSAALADLVQRHRIAAGLSQAELAGRCGLSERTLRDLERGNIAKPRRHSVQALAGALRLTGPQLAAFLAAARTPAATAPAGSAEAVAAAPLDQLFGRVTELRSLVEMVSAGRHRLITVTGPGGVGKTRLAAALVQELAHRSWDVRTAEVSALDDPELLLQTVAESFGVQTAARLGPLEALAAQLRGARAALVVDGAERVAAAAGDLAMLVRRCPGLTVVVTSQRPLRVGGERQLRLGPLPTADAVAMFEARAALAAQGFTVDDSNRQTVAAVCRWVDGLPLAIELAAARMRMLSPAELLARLDRPLALLAGGGPDRPERHRSLHATISSSLETAGPEATALFELLGLFSGGVALDDLESVATALGHSLLHGLAELVDMSLVRAQTVAGHTRYTLPDTVRHVAAERLAACGTCHEAHRAWASHYLNRLRHQESERALATREGDNLRAVIGWAITNEPGLFDEPVVHGLFRFYEVAGRLAEGQAALARIGPHGPPAAWVHAGHLARLRGDFTDARRLGELALRHLGPADHDGRSRAHLMLGSVATDTRELAGSRRHLHAALVHARRLGDLRLVGRVLNNLGTLSMELGRLRDAQRLLRAALEAKRRSDSGDIACGRTLFNLAETAVDDGHFETGLDYAREAMQLLHAGGHRRLAAWAATTAALAHLHRGRAGDALALCEQGHGWLSGEEHDDPRIAAVIDLRRSVVYHAAGRCTQAAVVLREAVPAGLANPERDREEVAYAIEMHADLMASRDPVAAARLLGTAGRLRHGSTRLPTAAWTTVADRAAGQCRERLGAAAFDRHRRNAYPLDWHGLAEISAALAKTAG